MGWKRCFLGAMLLSMGLLVVIDAGVIDWTTAALAHHHDDPDDGNQDATDADTNDRSVDAQHQEKQRCGDRPNPKKCRRRRDKQQRKHQNDDERGRGGGEDEADAPPPGPAATPAPEEACILPDLEDIETYGPFLCDVYRDLTPLVP